jgi:CheY-like chemotaxis protein
VHNTQNNSILVADDNKDIREMMRVLLDSEGYTVLEAEDGRQAVEIAKSERPGLILMDLHMPVLNGIDAIREIRRHPDLQDIPILANSGDGIYGMNLLLVIEQFGEGYIEYLPKPFNFETIVEKISFVLTSTQVAA